MGLGRALRLLAAAALLTDALASAVVLHDPLAAVPGVTFKRFPISHRTPSKLKISKHAVPLRKLLRSSDHPHTGADVALGFAQRMTGKGSGYTNVTVANSYGTSFAIDVTFNNYTMPLIVDSGSSDTWAVSSDFSCVDWLGTEFHQSLCGFGAAYPGGFKHRIDGQHFFIQYGSGEQISGPLGKLDVSVAGVTVKNQEVALANLTYWHGNNYTAGLVGLAYPSLTSAYYGGDSSQHNTLQQSTYSPLFSEMIGQGLLESPVWSIAINRNSTDGVLALGGIPYLPGIWTAPASRTDIIITEIVHTRPDTAFKPSFYTIIPDGIVYGKSKDETKFPYIVDTGTTLMYLPPQLAEAINGAFDPPAKFDWMYGGYFTSCDAVAPRFGVMIDGQTFYVNPTDMIFQNIRDPVTDLCQTMFTMGGSGPYVLGSTFLQNTLAVFDVGNQMMVFYSRPYY